MYRQKAFLDGFAPKDRSASTPSPSSNTPSEQHSHAEALAQDVGFATRAIHPKRAAENTKEQGQDSKSVLSAAPGGAGMHGEPPHKGRLGAILSEITDPIFVMDDKGQIIFVNASAAQLAGAEKQDLVGKSIFQVFAGLADPAFTAELEGQVRARTTLLEKANEELRRTIAEKTRATDALRESEQRLRSIMDSNPSVVFIKDTQGRYIFVNPQFQKLSGLTLDQIVGKTDEEIFLPEQAKVYRANDLLVFQSGLAKNFEEVAIHKDGLHTSIVLKFPLRDLRGNVYALCGFVTDITNHSEEEKRLRVSEARLRALVESMDDVAFEITEDGTYLNVWTANQSLLPSPRNELIGRRVGDFLGEEFARPFYETFKRVASTGHAETIEFTIPTDDGARWFSGRVHLIRADDEGAPRKLCVLVREITEHKRAHDALQDAYDVVTDQAQLLDLAHDAILVRDVSGAITFWNSGAEKVYGWTKDEAVGKNTHELLQTEFPEPREEIDRKLFSEGSWEGVLVHTRQGGKQITVESRQVLQHDAQGQPIAVLEINRDVTARRRAEEALKASEERFRLLIEGVKDYAIFMLNPDGSVMSWNRGAARTYGYRPEQVIGKNFSIFFPSEDIEAGRPESELERAASEGRFEEEGWRLRKDGSRFWANVIITALLNEEGALRGFSKVTRDITDRKRADESLRELSGRLLRLQDEERRRLGRELHDSTAQTLAALSLNISMLQQRPGVAADPTAAKAVADSLSLADNACREIRALSYLLHPPLLDDAGLTQALDWFVDGFVQRTNIPVDLKVSPDLPRLARDLETAIFRIVQECLTNIHRHAESPRAEIRLIRNATHVNLEVRDYGKGLPPSTFDSATDNPATIGVGIRGMRERARQLGGKLEIGPADPGTIVRAELPLTLG